MTYPWDTQVKIGADIEVENLSTLQMQLEQSTSSLVHADCFLSASFEERGTKIQKSCYGPTEEHQLACSSRRYDFTSALRETGQRVAYQARIRHKHNGVVIHIPIVLHCQARRVRVILSEYPQLDACITLQALHLLFQAAFLQH